MDVVLVRLPARLECLQSALRLMKAAPKHTWTPPDPCPSSHGPSDNKTSLRKTAQAWSCKFAVLKYHSVVLETGSLIISKGLYWEVTMSWGRGWEMRTSSGKMMFQRSLVSETSPATTWTSLALIQSRQHPFLLHHTHFHKQQGRANKLHPKLLENLQRQPRSSLRKAAGSSSSPRNPAWRMGTSSTNACFIEQTNAVLVRWVSSAAQGSVWWSWNSGSCTNDQGTTLSPSKDPETEAKFITKSFTINLLKRQFWKTQFLSTLNFITSRKKVHW